LTWGKGTLLKRNETLSWGRAAATAREWLARKGLQNLLERNKKRKSNRGKTCRSWLGGPQFNKGGGVSQTAVEGCESTITEEKS